MVCLAQQDKMYETSSIVALKYTDLHPTKSDQYFSKWGKGTIAFNDNTQSKPMLLRYNRWTDQLIWMRESDYYQGVVINENIKSFTLTLDNGRQTTFLNTQAIDYSITNVNFLQLLYSGNHLFLCKRGAQYLKSTNEFTTHNNFFLLHNDKLTPITLSKKSLLKLFDEAQAQRVKKVMKQYKLSYRNEYDIARLFEEINY